jgi:hypothetical protein
MRAMWVRRKSITWDAAWDPRVAGRDPATGSAHPIEVAAVEGYATGEMLGTAPRESVTPCAFEASY